MGSFGNADATSTAKENRFIKFLRQRWMGSEDCFIKHRVVGRYYVAAMLFTAVFIYLWNFMSIIINTSEGKFDETAPFHSALQNSTTTERNIIVHGPFFMEMCVQIPGALLIYTISSHKFLTAAVAISSFIHMLTPLAANYGTLVVAVYSQKLFLAPVRIAVLAMWKDWTPPGERKKFVILSLCGWIMFIPTLQTLGFLTFLSLSNESFYVSGACGLVWSLLWFFTVTDKPADDFQVIRERDIRLQNNTFSIFKEMPKLSGVPWKSIFTSMPVFSLCLLYFKIGSTSMLFYQMIIDSFNLSKEEDLGLPPYFYSLLFMSIYIVVFFISALITDFMTRKYPGMIKTRKLIIFGALIVHIILLLGLFINNDKVSVICLWMSLILLSTSYAGIFTNALELSSQYVSIIGGLIETSFFLGMVLSIVFLLKSDSIYETLQLRGAEIYYDIGFTIIVAVVFYIWGSLEEQPWSFNHSSGQENASLKLHPEQEEHELRGAVPLNA